MKRSISKNPANQKPQTIETKKLNRNGNKGFTALRNDIANCMKNLPASAFKIYVYLNSRDWTKAENYQGCFMKMRTIAEDCGYKNKSTVSRAVAMLETFGWLNTKPAGTKKMPDGKLIEMDCFEYEFTYPVDANGNIKVSPTREQMEAYRNTKNKVAIVNDEIVDDEILEEKGEIEETDMARKEIAKESTKLADRILEKLKVFNPVIADDRLQRDALAQLVRFIEDKTITLNDIVYTAEELDAKFDLITVMPTTILRHVGKYSRGAKGIFDGDWFGCNETQRPELYDYDSEPEFDCWSDYEDYCATCGCMSGEHNENGCESCHPWFPFECNGFEEGDPKKFVPQQTLSGYYKNLNRWRKAFLDAKIPRDEWRTFSGLVDTDSNQIGINDWLAIREDWNRIVEAFRPKCNNGLDLDFIQGKAAKRLLFTDTEPLTEEDFDFFKQLSKWLMDKSNPFPFGLHKSNSSVAL